MKRRILYLVLFIAGSQAIRATYGYPDMSWMQWVGHYLGSGLMVMAGVALR